MAVMGNLYLGAIDGPSFVADVDTMFFCSYRPKLKRSVDTEFTIQRLFEREARG
jgi:hypothetical protein